MTTMQKYAAIGVAVVAVIALGAQLVRPDQTNPVEHATEAFTAKMAIPQETADLLYSACGDCHSYRTVWPWYAKITPINWWIADHVDEGRHELNLSNWTYGDEKTRDKLDALIDEVHENGMPPGYYKPLHGANALTEAQRTSIVDWAKAELDRRGGPLPEGTEPD